MQQKQVLHQITSGPWGWQCPHLPSCRCNTLSFWSLWVSWIPMYPGIRQHFPNISSKIKLIISRWRLQSVKPSPASLRAQHPVWQHSSRVFYFSRISCLPSTTLHSRGLEATLVEPKWELLWRFMHISLYNLKLFYILLMLKVCVLCLHSLMISGFFLDIVWSIFNSRDCLYASH